MVFRGLDRECLHKAFWIPYFFSGDSKVVDSRNCWNLTEWGILPQTGGMRFVVKDDDLRQDITRRIYTQIKGDTEIKFTVRVDQLTTKPYFDGILMLGVGNSSTALHSGYYLKYAAVEIENKVYRETGEGIKIYDEPRSEYRLGASQNIIIRVKGSQVKIIADGELIRSATVSPGEDLVFWVIYSLPSDRGSLIAEISDLQIYDER